ncbi:MAG: mercuric reductase [Pirellulaceae bacterium]
MDKNFDVIWIGTGQATMTVVPRLLDAGKSVAVIEGGRFGGTCVNYGCTPTKTLVASAYAIHMARRGDVFGFSTGEVTVDFRQAMSTQQTNRRQSSDWMENRLQSLDGCTVLHGMGMFVDDSTVQVDQQKLTAETIVVHAGTRPNTPSVKGVDSIDWLTNESILDLDELPCHLVVVGGSYIALEFAQIFRRFGSRVTILLRGQRVLSKEDEDISRSVEELLEAEGVEILRNCVLEEVTPEDGVTLNLQIDDSPSSLSASHLLFAIGRVPNSDRVGAAAAGLKLTGRGHLEVNEITQTSVPHIYALGDINGRGAFTHTSVNDGEIFWDHYSRAIGVNREPPRLDRTIGMRTEISAMFVDPPLARVGMNESQARRSGKNVLLATMPMNKIARAKEKRETHGLVKILVDADTEQILGATVFGTGGDEVIGIFAALMQTGASYKLLRRVVFPHPTVSELMPWCLDGLEPLT